MYMLCPKCISNSYAYVRTHTQLRIGQNTSAYECDFARTYADVFWVNLNGHMHLDSLGSSICIWVRDDETHMQLRIGQNTSAYECAHMHMCCAHIQMCFGQSPNAYACAHMHMSSKRIWSITYAFQQLRVRHGKS